MSLYKIIPCERCGQPTSFERWDKTMPNEGNECDSCYRWLCDDCMDWDRCDDYSYYCKDCHEVT